MKQSEAVALFERLGLVPCSDNVHGVEIEFGEIQLGVEADGIVSVHTGNRALWDSSDTVPLPVRTVEELETIARIFKANS